ncbi:MAG: DEAD/DEAH box helicase [Gammaproteobacteria bacterium]|nr:DEAD/DEAH box helicase [Gammaproteobacteria bacterium]
MRFQDLGLLPELVTNTGYTEATPVQAEAIPHILEGRDVLAGAQTGTGKTAAFSLPMLQRLMASKTLDTPRALILAPTRELAAQVAQSVQTYAKGLGIRHSVIFGGVGFFPQVKALRRGVDVVIATPGRLLDHVNQRTIDLSRIEIVVLDEADRMLDMGFVHDIRRIIDLCRKDRQSLMFSATYNPPVKALAAQFLSQPVEVAVAHSQETAARIEQSFIHVDRTQKTALLTHLIGAHNWQQVLVFTKTKFGAERLATQLEIDGLPAVAMHGNKSQAQRTKALQRFKRGAVRVMVATDVAARGLDIEKLPHVINFELPMVADDYVHRIGRTGRGGESGVALSLVSADERHLFREIGRLLKTELTTSVVEGFEPASLSFEQAVSVHAVVSRLDAVAQGLVRLGQNHIVLQSHAEGVLLSVHPVVRNEVKHKQRPVNVRRETAARGERTVRVQHVGTGVSVLLVMGPRGLRRRVLREMPDPGPDMQRARQLMGRHRVRNAAPIGRRVHHARDEHLPTSSPAL